VMVESSDRGATFTVRLPQDAPQPAVGEVPHRDSAQGA